MESCTAVNEVIRQIHRGEFYGLFKTIFGATTQLFSENQITDSAKKNSDYAVVLSEWRFN
jgi:uncharacterized membrane protein YeiB